MALDDKIDALDERLSEKITEVRTVDQRLDAVARDIRIAIDIRERLAALEARRSPGG